MSDENDEPTTDSDGKAPRLKYEVPADPILITGATSGIGRALAHIVAERHAPLIVHGRDRQRGEALVEELRQIAGDSTVELVIADLASQAEIASMAKELSQKHVSLHALVNNAGVRAKERSVSKDGLEMNLAVNHVAPFLLVRELADSLAAGNGGRVINLNSMMHRRAALDWEDLNSEKNFSPTLTYANSKLLSLMTTYAWARRLLDRKVTVNAYDPGLVRTHSFEGLMKIFAPLIAKAPKTAASTAAFLAMSPKLDGASGGYYVATGSVKASSEESGDETLQEKAFTSTEALLKSPVPAK